MPRTGPQPRRTSSRVQSTPHQNNLRPTPRSTRRLFRKHYVICRRCLRKRDHRHRNMLDRRRLIPSRRRLQQRHPARSRPARPNRSASGNHLLAKIPANGRTSTAYRDPPDRAYPPLNCERPGNPGVVATLCVPASKNPVISALNGHRSNGFGVQCAVRDYRDIIKMQCLKFRLGNGRA